MNKLVLIGIAITIMATGCTTMQSQPDRGTQAIIAARVATLESTKSAEKRVTITVMSKDGKNFPIEVIKSANGEFIIPTDKVQTKYEMKLD